MYIINGYACYFKDIYRLGIYVKYILAGIESTSTKGKFLKVGSENNCTK